MPLSPRDIITQGTWHHALFTTYSLSLSFFESNLLNGGLRKKGCREIWVVADLDGYANSLAERQSRSVGQHYHLVPVALPRGVFHPKCGYLSGPDGDLLLIGSGNLTFGGYGKNIEVLEVFQSATHPTVFTQFADFLTALRNRQDFINPDNGWLDRFEPMARRAGSRTTAASDTPPPRLIHSTNQSVLDQLVETCRMIGPVSCARVLSPFFDPKAEAVVNLANRLALPRTVIGLVPGQDESSTFPFKTPPAALRAQAATIAVEGATRKLHAKWLELDLPENQRLTLTGSINATRQALCSTNNIEVGIIRVEPSSTSDRLHWKKAPLPTHSDSPDYEAPGLGNRALLHARLANDGWLLGRLFGTPCQSGLWRATLSRAEGDSITFQLSLAPDGQFSQKLESADQFIRSSGLQLRLFRDTTHARCWVQNDWLIELTHIGAVNAAPFIALFRGDATEEEEMAFLTFLHEGITDIAPQLAAHARSIKAAANSNSAPPIPEVSVDVAALAPSDGTTSNDARADTGADATSRGRRLAEVLHRLLKQFEETPDPVRSRSAVTQSEQDDLPDDEAVADTEDTEQTRAVHATERSLHRLRETVREHLGGDIASAAKRSLCSLWLIVELRTHLRGNDDNTAAFQFLREWFLQTSRACRCQSDTVPLDERMIIVAGLLGLTEPGSGRVGLHEAMEDFFANPATQAHFNSATRVPPLYSRLLPPGGDINSGISSIRSARTRRQEIAIVRDCATQRQTPPNDLSVFKSSDGKALHELLVSKQTKVCLKELNPDRQRSGCPHCYMTISPAAVATIRIQRLGRCINCQKFIYDLSPRS